MKVTPQGVGRLFWFRYYGLKVSGIDDTFAPHATFSFGEHTIDVPIFCEEGTGTSSQLWVVVFPCMDIPEQALCVRDGNDTTIWQRSLTPRGLNLNNSVTCRVKRRLTEQMRGVEQRHRDECAFIEPLAIYPYDDDFEVVRIHILYPKGVVPPTPSPDGILINTHADCSMVLESMLDDDRRHRVVLSYRVSKNGGELVFAVPGTSDYQPGLLYMPPILRSEYVEGFAKFTCDAAGDARYASWFDAHRATPEELDLQRTTHFDFKPLISIVTPVYQVPLGFLKECLESVVAQTYAEWELLVVNASPEDEAISSYLHSMAAQDTRIRVLTMDGNKGIVGNTNAGIAVTQGSYVAFLDQDDLLEPDALYHYVARINQNREAGLIYCDEDSFTTGLDTVFSPRFKPNYNPDLLYAQNYIVHLLMIRRDLLEQVGLSMPDVEGAQDHDLSLKISEIAPVEHIARVLYHWRQHEQSTNSGNLAAKPYAMQAGINAVQAHFDRCGVPASVSKATSPYTYHVTYLTESEPRVSIIIPTMDHTDLLDDCVTSLLAKAGWDNLEILLIENNSKDPATFSFYDELLARDKRIRLLRYEGDFNYSKIINFGAHQATGSHLLLLNNDTRVASQGCIRTMVGYFQRNEVGVVGPLLLYPDGMVQSAGLALMADKRLGFMNQNLTLATHGGYLGSLECPRTYSAVLGAAQMVPKELFDQLGGYDENLAVTYNDVDFCWRVREAGKLVVYTPYAQFFHREFATRGHDNANAERAAQAKVEAELMLRRWPSYFEQGDPELNPGCDPANPWFKLPQK